MGRGRAKAKQTKVARQLKYGVPQTDLERLQAELRGDSGNGHDQEPEGDDLSEDPYDDDPYAAYLDDEDEDDEHGGADEAR